APRRPQRRGAKMSILPMLIVRRLCFVRYQKSFSCFANGNQSNVVILRERTGKIAHILDNSLHNRRRTVSRAGADRLNRAVKAEFVSFSIERFRHAVGVENEAIIALERDGEIGSEPIEHISAVNSYDHSRRFYRHNSLRFSLIE